MLLNRIQAVAAGITIIVSAVLMATATGSQIAFDSAGDSAYNNGFTQGSNGGLGWGGGWSIQTTSPGLAFADLGDSTTNGPGDHYGIGDINSPEVAGGRAWALNGDNEATRTFAGPLGLGQIFSVDFDNGFVGPPLPRYSMTLNTVSGADGISFVAEIQYSTYLISYSGTQIDTHIPITYDGLHLAFTREPGSYLVSATPYAPGSTMALINVPLNQDISSVTLQIADDAIGPTNSTETLYFNNTQITPDPGDVGLLVLAASAMPRRRDTLARRQ